MRALFLLGLAMVILINSPVSADDEVTITPEQRWEELFRARMHVLEQRHGIKFDPDWEPRVTFGLPESVSRSINSGFNAWYMSDTESFMVGPPYRNEKFNLAEFQEDIIAIGEFASNRNQFRELVDHELGHRLTDEIMRSLGLGTVPTSEQLQSWDLERLTGFQIIAEGIGCYYESTSLVSSVPLHSEKGQYLFPSSYDDKIWDYSGYFTYGGGAWLVRPILERYGEEGIVYLVTHPLTFTNGDVYSAAVAYQRRALEELAR